MLVSLCCCCLDICRPLVGGASLGKEATKFINKFTLACLSPACVDALGPKPRSAKVTRWIESDTSGGPRLHPLRRWPMRRAPQPDGTRPSGIKSIPIRAPIRHVLKLIRHFIRDRPRAPCASPAEGAGHAARPGVTQIPCLLRRLTPMLKRAQARHNGSTSRRPIGARLWCDRRRTRPQTRWYVRACGAPHALARVPTGAGATPCRLASQQYRGLTEAPPVRSPGQRPA